jgi:hypothetical protein
MVGSILVSSRCKNVNVNVLRSFEDLTSFCPLYLGAARAKSSKQDGLPDCAGLARLLRPWWCSKETLAVISLLLFPL